MDDYIFKNGKVLRKGYTTGSCATASVAASVYMLINNKKINNIKIKLPSGNEVLFNLLDIEINENFVSASIIKDGGDDPDITNGIKIIGKAELSEKGIEIKGGMGVGIVKSKGLKVKVGEPAINPVPRKMIIENIERILKNSNYKGGVIVTISAENGEEIAKKTFNPRLGIEGGISILGTTGIVEPMSDQALIDTIKILIDKQKIINQENIILCLGNYGKDFLKSNFNIEEDNSVKISNFIGEALDYIVYKNFKRVFIIGHIGKLVKLAGGIMNTHSSIADCRMEIFASHTALTGLSKEKIKLIMDSKTTEEVIEYLRDWNTLEPVLSSILEKILFHINFRVKNQISADVLLFSNDGLLIKTHNADDFI